MSTLLFDLRSAMRAWRRTPLLFVSGVVSIAIGVGANTAIYSWMDNLVFNPFPGIRDPDRVVGVETGYANRDGGPVAYRTLEEWRAASRSFSGIAAWSMARLSARREGEAASTSLVAVLVSGEYFEVLGGAVVLGRPIVPGDAAARAPVAVLGHEAWRRLFSSDPEVVGRTLYLNGQSFSIVGVSAPRFVGIYLGVVPDLFVPLTLQPSLTGADALADRNARAFQAVARLGDGIGVDDAARELDAVARRLSVGYGDRPVLGAVVTPARLRYLGGLLSPVLGATLVITALLLLVACANVAGLLLVRATVRSAELSLRRALGASGARVGRLILLESLLLGVTGSAVGVAIAYAVRGALHEFIPTASFPITLSIDLNPRVLGFAALAAVGVTVLAGLLPAWRASRTSLEQALRASSPTLGPDAARLRFAIVGAQVAFCFACLATAGLFLRALGAATNLQLGFQAPATVLLVNTDLAPAQIAPAQRSGTIQAILRELRATPGIERASLASFVPLGFGGRRASVVQVDGYLAGPEEDMSVLRIAISGDYAATMGIYVVSGREFEEADREGGERVALVNQTFAERFWADRSPLGGRVGFDSSWATVVGVVQDGKYGSLAESAQPVVYVHLEQWPPPAFTVHVRTRGPALAMVEPVREALQRVHVDLPALQARTLNDQIAASTFAPRVGAIVLAIFGGVALLLALVGLHAAIAFAVAAGARELGIRVALGAGSADVLARVLHPALRPVFIGSALGALLAGLLGAALRSRLPDLAAVSVLDPAVLAGSGALIGVAALVAAWVPGRRALRLDPVMVLRDG